MQLSKSEPFMETGYFGLANAKTGDLGGAVLSMDSFVIEPGEALDRTVSLEQEAKVIGVLVGFRDLEQSVWRAAIGLPEAKKKSWFHLPKFLQRGKPAIQYDVTVRDLRVSIKPANGND